MACVMLLRSIVMRWMMIFNNNNLYEIHLHHYSIICFHAKIIYSARFLKIRPAEF